MKIIQVAALVLEDQDGKILIGQRRDGDSNQKKWEFPGGKLQVGENFEDALVREIDEELGIVLQGFSFLEEVTHEYPMIQVRIRFYYAKMHIENDLDHPAHQQLKWVARSELTNFDFLDANQGIVRQLSQTHLSPDF